MRIRYHGRHARNHYLRLAVFPAVGALALAPVIVRNGDTLSGIAASHGVSLGAVEQANPQIANPDLIYAGQRVSLPGSAGRDGGSAPAHGYSPPASQPAPSGGDLADVPGVPRAFAACVALRESSNNPRAVNSVPGYIGNGGGAYGIMAYTWQGSDLGYSGQPYDAPLSQQKQAFSILYAKYGTQPWSPSDHC